MTGAIYKQRNRIERMFGHLKINRAIATRYDQLANAVDTPSKAAARHQYLLSTPTLNGVSDVRIQLS